MYRGVLTITYLIPCYIAGCNEIDDGIFNLNHSTFSQAPGAEIMLTCNSDMMVNIITCGDDGRWEPDASSALCQISDSESKLIIN